MRTCCNRLSQQPTLTRWSDVSRAMSRGSGPCNTDMHQAQAQNFTTTLSNFLLTLKYAVDSPAQACAPSCQVHPQLWHCDHRHWIAYLQGGALQLLLGSGPNTVWPRGNTVRCVYGLGKARVEGVLLWGPEVMSMGCWWMRMLRKTVDQQ